MASPARTIEIYGPGDGHTPIAVFDVENPTFALSRGDLLHPGFFGDWMSNNPGQMLRIVNVEHILWSDSPEGRKGLKHKICIYTESYDDTERSRYRKE